MIGSGATHAQTVRQNAGATSIAVPEITISSEKVEGLTTYDAPGTITVKTGQEMDRQNVNNARDFVRDEPGISVGTNSGQGTQVGRTGSTGYVIRGIGENRVRIEIDGVKVPDYPQTNAGSPTGYTRDFVDYDSLKRIEIIRGPASALYGSDAIGGVVSFVTKDPSDFLNKIGKDWFVSQKGGFDTADNSIYGTSTGAGRIGNWESMILYTYRYGQEYKPATFLPPNPQRTRTDNVLAKVVNNDPAWGQFKVTGEFTRRRISTQLNTDEITTTSPSPLRVFDSNALDTNERPRVSLDWTKNGNWWFADMATAKLYWTRINRDESQYQYRAPSVAATTPTQLRYSLFNFTQDITGTEIRMSARRNILGWDHQITYGFAGDLTSTTRPRDRYQQTLSSGVITTTVAGENFPNKNFPDTDTTNAGFYVQDIMQSGALRLIPAVRYDYYHITPHPDASFLRSNFAGFQINEQTDTAVSPKFGATYDLTENYRLFGQFTRGFRAPPYDNANFAFRNPTSFYDIIPNGNLKPETSTGYEGGLRGHFQNGSSFQVSAYYNKYKDFIDTVTLANPPPPGITIFQYQNLSNVTIYGVEGKGEWRFTPIWSVFGSFAYAYGTFTQNQINGPLNSVDPFTSVSGLRYRNMGWVAEGRVRYASTKDRVYTTAGAVSPTFVVPAHTAVDALVSYDVDPNFTVNLGIFNIFDAAFWDAQSVVGIATNNPYLELFRNAGRTVALNATYRW
jgi:hemoglobin/transferrin/lactoferrin receptor protein